LTLDAKFDLDTLSTLEADKWYMFYFRAGSRQKIKITSNDGQILTGYIGAALKNPYSASYDEVTCSVRKISKYKVTPATFLVPIGGLALLLLLGAVTPNGLPMP
jgi:hypothetical protein